MALLNPGCLGFMLCLFPGRFERGKFQSCSCCSRLLFSPQKSWIHKYICIWQKGGGTRGAGSEVQHVLINSALLPASCLAGWLKLLKRCHILQCEHPAVWCLTCRTEAQIPFLPLSCVYWYRKCHKQLGCLLPRLCLGACSDITKNDQHSGRARSPEYTTLPSVWFYLIRGLVLECIKILFVLLHNWHGSNFNLAAG